MRKSSKAVKATLAITMSLAIAFASVPMPADAWLRDLVDKVVEKVKEVVEKPERDRGDDRDDDRDSWSSGDNRDSKKEGDAQDALMKNHNIDYVGLSGPNSNSSASDILSKINSDQYEIIRIKDTGQDLGKDRDKYIGMSKDRTELIFLKEKEKPSRDDRDDDRDDRDDEPKRPTPPGGNEDPITPPHRPITPNPTEVYPIVPPVTPPGGPSPNPLIPPVKPPVPPKPPKPPYPGDTSSVVPNPGPCTNSVTWTETTYTYDATSNSDK